MQDHPNMEPPKNLDGYLEMMSRAVFAAGLNWTVVDKKWPGIKKAFADFSVTKVSAFDQNDVDTLMKNTDIVRNYKKVIATINNANSISALEQEFSSFQKYFNSFPNEETLIKDLGKRFSFLGPSTAVMFLYGVGQKTSHQQWKK